MEFKGTKGKWFIENLNEPKEGRYPAFEIDISTEQESNMCTVWYSDSFDEQAKANALLISKAPEMLEILNWFVEYFEDLYVDGSEVNDKVIETKQLIKEATEIN
jgi:hypothetical protein